MLDRLYPTPTIRHGQIDGLYVILDLRTQDYFILNERASFIWKLILDGDGDLPWVLQKMKEQFPGHEHLLASQLEQVSSDWTKSGYLMAGKVAESGPAPRLSRCRPYWPHFLALRAWWSLLSTALALRRFGFSHTYLMYSDLALLGAQPERTALLPAAERAFRQAENFFWLPRAPNDCLPRSLALFRFLRRTGLPVAHRIGGRRFPAFAMHAWVEHCGTVVLDDPGRSSEYQVLATIP